MSDPHPLRRALPLIVLAGLSFSLLDATAKYLSREHSLLAIVWARYVGQMFVTTPLAWYRNGSGFLRTFHPGLQLLRSACLVTATLCFFGGLRYLPLAEASAITFLAPMFAIPFSGPVLGERPTRARWLSALGGFLGILVLLRPGSAVFHPAVAFLFMAAVANAFYQLLTRKMPRDGPDTMLFYSGLVGMVVLSLALPAIDLPTTRRAIDAVLFALLGVLGGLGHAFLIGAFLRAPASLVAPFTYLQMIWATLWGYLVFGQLPDGFSGLGMAIIVASGILLVLHERHGRSRSP